MSNPLPPTTLIFAPKGRRPLAFPIVRGQVVVISDESGILPNDWQLSLLENSQSGTARVVQDGDIISQKLLHLVGFNLPLPDLPVREYLTTFCSDPDSILREFELSEVASLSCAYLPPAPSRQIALLNAFSQEGGVIVLNDPFLPFNGRWRESFAAFIAEQTSLGGAAVVCCNVGFAPKTWTTLPSVKTQDVAGLLPLPAEARATSSQQATEHSSTPSSNATPRQINEANEAYYAPGIPLPIPASAIKVYKEVKDWIFEPLATASRFLRTWRGIVVALGLSVVLGAMGIILIPNLPEARAILVRLSEKFTYQWAEVAPSVPQASVPQPSVPQAHSPEQQPSTTEPAKLAKPAGENPSPQAEHEEKTPSENPLHSTEGALVDGHNPRSPFPYASGIPLQAENPPFLLHIAEPIYDGESTEFIKGLITAVQGGDAKFSSSFDLYSRLPFGTLLSPTLSYSYPPFSPTIGWTKNLRNLQDLNTIHLFPSKNNEDETEITPQGDTDPLANQK